LITIGAKSSPHIRHLSLHDLAQQRSDLVQEAVSHVVVPGGNENTVIGLEDEVVRDVVDDDRLVDVTAQQRQVLHQERPVLTRVLPVESVFNVVANVDLVDDLVGVLLQSRSEDHDFVVSSHRFDELHAPRSHKEEAIVLVLKGQRVG